MVGLDVCQQAIIARMGAWQQRRDRPNLSRSKLKPLNGFDELSGDLGVPSASPT